MFPVCFLYVRLRARETPRRPPGRAAGQSHLEISGRLADIAIAGQGGARPPSSLLPLFSEEE